MFTGIIKQVGSVRAIEQFGEDLRLSIDAAGFAAGRDTGDSIAVNGVCLTLLDGGDVMRFDVSVETLSRTLIGGYRVGQSVNLEPALTATAPLGGHLVSGHVDGTAILSRLEPSARSTLYDFQASRELARFIANKGSVCIDGISLTVNAVRDLVDAVEFSVNIVPHTLASTNLDSRRVGDGVHLEVDLVARYLARIYEQSQI